MIRYLIKNNIKLMSRSSINILCFVLAPLLVSAVLMSAFSTLMEKYEDAGSFTVGYRISGEKIKIYLGEAIDKLSENNDISFVEYPAGNIEETVNNNDIACFIEFNDDQYLIYEKQGYEIHGKIAESILSIFYNSVSLGTAAIDAADITVNKADFIPPVDSVDYYGIIEIIYFGWCAIVCAAALFTNEKKYMIRNKYTVSGISEFKFYLARFISLASVVLTGITISAIISALMLDVHWGNLLLSGLIVMVSIMAATAFGIMLYTITDSMVLTIIFAFSIVWIWGFFGGSFETYMFSSLSETLKKISPIYHENRALIEILLQGKSDYLLSALCYSGAIAVGCSAVSVFAGYLRRLGRK